MPLPGKPAEVLIIVSGEHTGPVCIVTKSSRRSPYARWTGTASRQPRHFASTQSETAVQFTLLASNFPAVSDERTLPGAGDRLAAVGLVGTARSLATPSDAA